MTQKKIPQLGMLPSSLSFIYVLFHGLSEYWILIGWQVGSITV